MKRKKITIVGAGNVGATAAHIAAMKELGDIVLIDIIEGLAEGKALDMSQAAHIQSYNSDIIGTSDWEKAKDSDIVIITSGLARKPGMSRDDLLAKNTQIVMNVSRQISKYAPDSIVIVVCNPLDAMVYVAAKTTGFEKKRIVGMAGALDSARFSYFLSCELGVSVKDIQSVLMGGHGDDMVPLPRFTTVGGIPVTNLLGGDVLDKLIERTRHGGIEIVNYLGYSAYYAPAAGAVKMAEAIIKDQKILISCCAYCDKEYGIGGYFVGVPVILGRNGVEKVIKLELNRQEQVLLEKSLNHVKQLTKKVENLAAENS